MDKKEQLLKKTNELNLVFSSRSVMRPEDMGPGNIKRIKRLFRYRGKYIKRIWERSGLMPEKDIKIKTFWGKELILPNRDYNARKLFEFGTLGGSEQKLMKFFIKNFNINDVFYDIGANYGFYTALAQELIENGEVHAFEPSFKVFQYLKQLANNNNFTFLNNIALSDMSGEISFFDGYAKHRSGKSTTIKEIAKLNLLKHKVVTVKALTIDDYCKNHSLPDLIKIDVEGGESKVLRGAEKTLKKKFPIIAIELWSGERSHFSYKALCIMEEFGYCPFSITSEGDLKKLSFGDLKNILNGHKSEANFIFQKI